MAHCSEHDSPQPCVECEVTQLARNHYFTGKLLVLRDFNDEQRYFMGKDRRHNQRLHGWGAVCGLKVKQHPTEACRNQYVVIEPGTAIDCCGREILVTHEEYFDFRARFREYWKQTFGEQSEPDDKARTLQICVRYAECPTEDVPALFDECSCDDTACQPNRIRESHTFDLMIKPDKPAEDPIGAQLVWADTQNLARAHRVELMQHPIAGKNFYKYYVATRSQAGSSVYAYYSDKNNPAGSFNLPANDLALALSAKGDRLYVAVDQTDPILILNTDPLGGPNTLVNTLPLAHAPGSDIHLAASPDGRLYALAASEKKVTVWDAAIDQSPVNLNTAKLGEIAVGAAPRSLVVSPDGKLVFVANGGDGTISVIETDKLGNPAITLNLPAGSVPVALAVAQTTAGLRLYVADDVKKGVRVYGVQLGAPQPFPELGLSPSLGSTTLIDLVASPGGKWLYVLTADAAGKGALTPIDAHKVETGAPGALGTAVPIGDGPRDLALAEDGRRLYVAYNGLANDEASGGVAILSVAEESCADIFKRALDPCPECDGGECIVLATIGDYVYNNPISDGQIDNWTDRQLLPSTNLIVEVLKCLLDRGTGGGERGEPGLPGKDGLGIDDVKVTFVECDQPESAGVEVIGGKRILKLTVRRGCDGDPGKDGLGIDDVKVTFVECDQPGSASIKMIGGKRILVLEIPGNCEDKVDLTHICAINWIHPRAPIDDPSNLTPLPAVSDGLMVAFDKPVRSGDIHRHSFIVQRGEFNDAAGGKVICWCDVPPEVIRGVKFESDCKISEFETVPDPNDFVNGALFIPSNRFLPDFEYRVVIKGDYIRDENDRALDADHLPQWLPNRPTGDGVEGGTFESWFMLKQG